jgi:hypothetical protein
VVLVVLVAAALVGLTLLARQAQLTQAQAVELQVTIQLCPALVVQEFLL